MAKSVFTGKEIPEGSEFSGGGSVSSAMESIFYDKRPALEAEIEDSITTGVEKKITEADQGSWDTSDSLQVARAFTDGMWLNKGEEVGAWIGASVYKLFGMYGSEDKTVAQIKDEMLARSEADSAAFVEERPVAAIGANIAGSILSPVSMKGGQLLGQAANLRKGELARQSAMQTRTALGGSGPVGTAAKAAEDASKTAQLYSGLSPRVYDIVTKTPTPLLGTGLITAESAVIGAEGDTLGERAENALISGAIGGAFGGALSLGGVAVNQVLKDRIAQRVGKDANFVNLMFTEHGLAPVYQHVVSKAYGARSLIEQQVMSLKNRLPSLDLMKERGVNLKENAKKTLARAKAISAGNKEQQIEQAKELAKDLGSDLKVQNKIEKLDLDEVSQQRIDALENSVDVGAELVNSCNVFGLAKEEKHWRVQSSKGDFKTKRVLVAAGSSKAVWSLMEDLGHSIVKPVPSLFTFNTKDIRLKDLAGLSVPKALLKIEGQKLRSKGPLLITHWGMSGPAILKLSAWGAQELAGLGYKFTLIINFTGLEKEVAEDELADMIKDNPKKQLVNMPSFNIPKRLWKSLIPQHLSSINNAALSIKNCKEILDALCSAHFKINGKSTFKDEFVTAGGIELSEVDFRTMGSKILPGLHFAGEVLNIDAITGGFNFQAAWTTGFLVAQTIQKDS